MITAEEIARSKMGQYEFLLVIIMLGCTSFILAQPVVHHYDFVVKETNFTKNCYSKSMLTVNDSFPGPVIRVRKGDTAFVNVHNHGSYGVTIHWHGVKQPRNPWSDGPEYITQCAIAPGTNFTYQVIFSTEEGTLWWHAHSDWTLSSVHGAIVILPAEGSTHPFPEPDAEEIIVLESWYDDDVNEDLWNDLSVGADLPRANSYAINGELGAFSNCSSSETTYRFFVDYGKTYLLRIVGAMVNSELFFAIAEHNLTVVGMDGSYVKPFTTSYLVISTGQTINVLFTANQAPGEYFMAARGFVSVGKADIAVPTTAVLEYRGSYVRPSEPIFPSSLPPLRDIDAAQDYWMKLRSLADEKHPVDVPQNISTQMFIVVSQKIINCPNSSCESLGGNRIASAMNNITFDNPGIDVLQAYYRNISGVYTPDFPDKPDVLYNFTGNKTYETPEIATRIKMLDYNETVEIVFQGTNVLEGAVDHPMHLHGHSFYVVGSGIGNFDNETDPKRYNLVDPPEVNTFRAPKLGWVAIRYRANNPGVWFWHCHLTKHLTWGMETAFITRSGGTPETSVLDPPPSMPQCTSSFNHLILDFDDSTVNLDDQSLAI